MSQGGADIKMLHNTYPVENSWLILKQQDSGADNKSSANVSSACRVHGIDTGRKRDLDSILQRLSIHRPGKRAIMVFDLISDNVHLTRRIERRAAQYFRKPQQQR